MYVHKYVYEKCGTNQSEVRIFPSQTWAYNYGLFLHEHGQHGENECELIYFDCPLKYHHAIET